MSKRIAPSLLLLSVMLCEVPLARAQLCLPDAELEQVIEDFARGRASGTPPVGWLEVREGERCERPLSATAVLVAPFVEALYFRGEDRAKRTGAQRARAKRAEKAIVVQQGGEGRAGFIKLTLRDRDALFIDPANPMVTFIYRLRATWVQDVVAQAGVGDASTARSTRCVTTMSFRTRHASDRKGGADQELDLENYRVKIVGAKVVIGHKTEPLALEATLPWEQANGILRTALGTLAFRNKTNPDVLIGEFVWEENSGGKTVRFDFVLEERVASAQQDGAKRALVIRPDAVDVTNDCRPPVLVCPPPEELFGYFVGRVKLGFPFIGLGMGYEWRHPRFTWSIGGQVDLDYDRALELIAPAQETPAKYITAGSLEWRAGPTLYEIDILAGIAFGMALGDAGADPYFSPRVVLAPTRLPITLGLGIASQLDHEAPVRPFAFMEWEHNW